MSATSTPPLPDLPPGSPERSTPLVDEVRDDEGVPLEDLAVLGSHLAQLERNGGDRFSPVSNASLGPPSPAHHDLSSFSEESVLALEDALNGRSPSPTPQTRPRSRDLEDGEIEIREERRALAKTRARKGGGKKKRRERRASSRGRSPDYRELELARRRHDLPRYDVRNLINRRRGYDRSPSPAPRRKSRGRSYGRSRSPSRSPSPRRKKRAKGAARLATKKTKDRTVTSEAPPLDTPKKKKTKEVSAKKKKTKRAKSPESGRKKGRRLRHSSEDEPSVSLAQPLRARRKGTPKRSSAPVAKEVFASGDNILVSVNFGSSPPPKTNVSRTTELAHPEVANKKPDAVIDIMSSPYLVIEASPKETIDLALSDEEPTVADASPAAAVVTVVSPQPPIASNIVTTTTSVLPEAPPAHTTANATLESAFQMASQIVNSLPKGPCTPPGNEDEAIDFAKGPQTPQSDLGDSYDPCNPTESPEIDFSPDNGDNSSPLLNDTPSKRLNSSLDSPFLAGSAASEKASNGHHSSLSMDVPMDIAVDSPNSPHGSDLSDLFEPPTLTSSAKKKTLKVKSAAHLSKPSETDAVSKAWSLHGESFFASLKVGRNSKSTPKKANKSVQMRLVDDKLRIIDDVPTSAVEMAVKEKFLKKVQRQERIVDEIKTVLKPFYNKKKISKASYKEIMRKCVPKVLEDKSSGSVWKLLPVLLSFLTSSFNGVLLLVLFVYFLGSLFFRRRLLSKSGSSSSSSSPPPPEDEPRRLLAVSSGATTGSGSSSSGRPSPSDRRKMPLSTAVESNPPPLGQA
eukprot:maker-scaffold1122_size61463-snap-gene-0.17 protein:Tk03595 transcript:maker-scaffold1122_size61463-snap-gene-0.17-mRNA-1 annotation:"phd and ring finger domain-containing protein 1 isoform x2"